MTTEERFTAGRVSWVIVAGLFVLAVANAVGWRILHGWYGLLENRDNTHFAFEKVPGWFDSPQMRGTALLFLGLAVAYLAGYQLLRAAPVLTPAIKVAMGLTLAGPIIATVLLYPVGALDVFNYMIELKLTYHYDQNPYLTTFAAYRDDPFALPAFLVDVPLFYGPVWLLLSWIPVAVAGTSDVIRLLIALKLFNVLLIALTAWLIASYQENRRRGWIAGWLFLANPLVLFEGVANAHNDVMMTALLIAAIVLLQRRSLLAGPLLALSVLVKLYTLVLAPLFLAAALAARWGWRRVATGTLLGAAAVALVVTPFWSGGEMIDGFRNGLDRSQRFDHVSPYSLAQQWELEKIARSAEDPNWLRQYASSDIVPRERQDELRNRFALTFIVLAGLLALSCWRGRATGSVALETLLLLLLLLTNLYPWYLIPVIAVALLRPDRLQLTYMFVATALGLVYYPMYVYGHFNTGWTRFEVHLFLALFLTAPMLLFLLARVVQGVLYLRAPGSLRMPRLPRPAEARLPAGERLRSR